MKISRIIAVAAAAISVISCLDLGSTNKSTYQLHTSFDYQNVLRSDSLYFDNQNGEGFGWMSMVGYWNDIFFCHKVSADKSMFLGGFILSGLKGAGNGDPYYDSFRVNSGAGLGGSPIYAVFCEDPDKRLMPEKHWYFIQKDFGTCHPVACYVNNTTAVVKAVKEKFTVGDRLTLKVTGYLDNAKTGEAQISLADFSAQKDSIVVNWTPFKLDALGSVDRLEFSMHSTKEGIPSYFCMDSMYNNIALEY